MQANNSDPRNSNLEHLMANARRGAENNMRDHGTVETMFTAISPSTFLVLPGRDLKKEEDMALYERFIRLWCVAAAATAGVLVSEVWVASPKPEGTPGGFIRPSLNPDRREGILLSGEAMGGIFLQRFLPIQRDSAGQFTGFGPAESFPEPLAGRYSRLLPIRTPSQQQQRAALKKSAAFGRRMARRGFEVDPSQTQNRQKQPPSGQPT